MSEKNMSEEGKQEKKEKEKSPQVPPIFGWSMIKLKEAKNRHQRSSRAISSWTLGNQIYSQH